MPHLPLPLGEVPPKGAERALSVSFADSSPMGGAKTVKNLSLRTGDIKEMKKIGKHRGFG